MTPTPHLNRRGLASLILSFGVHLTQLSLTVDPDWHPRSKPSPIPKTPVKQNQKAHIDGEPTYTTLDSIERHPYFLDPVVSYLPHLTLLKWNGPLASSNLFMFLGSKVRTVEYGYSSEVKPLLVAKILRRSVNRTIQTRSVRLLLLVLNVVELTGSLSQLDGTVSSRLTSVKNSPALKCITVKVRPSFPSSPN